MSMISVGMPVLNGAGSIATAVRDLQNQTFADFELVICDNHSDDDTVAIARALGKEDPRIRVIAFDERVDILHSFRRALENTTAPFFMFAPADDRWYATFMEDALRVLQENPQAIACSGRVAFHRKGRFSHISRGTNALTGTPEQNLACYLSDPVENARAFSLIRRSAMQDVFPEREYPGWDFQMTARTLRHGHYLEIPRVLAERDDTEVEVYIRQAERLAGKVWWIRFPLWRTATEVLQDRQIPKSMRLYRALLRLVWISHVNYASCRMPRWHRVLGRIEAFFYVGTLGKRLPMPAQTRADGMRSE